MKYRLALDIGSQSIGWAVLRLNDEQPNKPFAIAKSGVRIFGDGRNPKDGTSLAVTRRNARAMRRRRDRLLRRKTRLLKALTEFGFFPQDLKARKQLAVLNPYELRAKGLDRQLAPEEFARALFHLNQRRGFKSNRKTDAKDSESGALKTAIAQSKQRLTEDGCRTIGEWLYQRFKKNKTVRARYLEIRVTTDGGGSKLSRYYDLYIDRAMVEDEFNQLWEAQSHFNPVLFTDKARDELADCLFFQRPLKPVPPGRCSLLPDESRAPLALPSQQRFRIYQELNHLRVLQEGLREGPALSLADRNALADELEKRNLSFSSAIPKLLGLPGNVRFNLADDKRTLIKANATSLLLRKKEYFGSLWDGFAWELQDAIVMRLLEEESEAQLIRWLIDTTGVDEQQAESIAGASLPDGYGSLSKKALDLILPELQHSVQTYDKAVKAAGFDHSRLGHFDEVPGRTFPVQHMVRGTGEVQTLHVFERLPYYGEFLQRHVGFADPKATQNSSDEKRFGRIPNPTVHIGLNQVRVLVNALIERYGHPAEVIVELARELKLNKKQKDDLRKEQAVNQKRNERLRAEIAEVLGISSERVSRADIQKAILWEELSSDPLRRCCPYSGQAINKHMLLSAEVEVEHILPFSRTLDDSFSNKTVALRKANRVKGNRSPWEAREDFAAQGWPYDEIELRALAFTNKRKRDRFSADAMARWESEESGFLARALTDTQYLSRVAREYLSLICPQATRVIPGQMTAKLRHHFGLNGILGLSGEKNRNDHRHHAVDACVIGVTDQGMLKRFADASKQTYENSLNRLVERMPLPWPHYLEHVNRAINNIWVSHRPDHGYQGAMMEETSYGIRKDGSIRQRSKADGSEGRTIKSLIKISDPGQLERHGIDADGKALPYKGYVGGSNYCIEIVSNPKGRWEGEVVSTFDAYQIAREHGEARLRHSGLSCSGKPLVMRLIRDDCLRMEDGDKRIVTMRVAQLKANGAIILAPINEANVDARNRDKDDPFKYVSKTAGSLQKAKGRRITVSPIGVLRDPGFSG